MDIPGDQILTKQMMFHFVIITVNLRASLVAEW